MLLAFHWAADLEDALGSPSYAALRREAAGTLRTTISRLYWDQTRQLFADTPDRKDFSQHANTLAVLANVITGEDARALVNRILGDTSLTQCTFYFRHYLHSAVNQVGEGDRYLDLLADWDAMLDRGLTTWAEKQDPTRSDCHAWSASPNFELLRTVLGIDSAAPGFARVTVKPFLGKLSRVAGAVPHPAGEVTVSLAREGEDRISAEVTLPRGVSGRFHWRGRTRELPSGGGRFVL